MSTRRGPARTSASRFELSDALVLTLDRRLRVIASIPTDGVNGEDLHAVPFCDLVRTDTQEVVYRGLAELLSGQRVRYAELDVAVDLPGGRSFDGALSATAVPSSGRVDHVVVVLHGRASPGSPPRSRSSFTLSDLDARILEGLASGQSTVQLAASLSLSEGGVEYHLRGLTRRLKVRNRPALVSKAYSVGLLQAGAWPPKVPVEYVQ